MIGGLLALEKVLAILPVVQANQGIRVSELSRITGIPEAEIVTDLPDLVNLCGVPPYSPVDLVDLAVENDRVTIRFAEQFRRPVRLTLREALAVDMALAGCEEQEDGPFARAVAGIRAKLREAVSPEVAEELVKAGEGIRLVHSPGLAARLLGVIREAMNRQVEVRIEYFSRSRGRVEERTIQPYGFFEQGGHWYVVALAVERNEVRTFRADRIKSAVPTERDFEVREDFDISAYRTAGPPEPGDPALAVSLRFDAAVARFAMEGFPAEAFKEAPDGSVVARVLTGSTPWLVAELMRWGGTVEVTSPPSLAREVRDRALATLEIYGE